MYFKNKLILNRFYLKSVLVLSILLFFTKISGQEHSLYQPPNVAFPVSPNVAELAKYVDTPVGYYSGTPSINVPLYTINTGGFSIPISLGYNASGIKVSQEASSVGLGWSLNAGGMITRQIRGYDDFNYTPVPGYIKAAHPYYAYPLSDVIDQTPVCNGVYYTGGPAGETHFSDCTIGIPSAITTNLVVINPLKQKFDADPDLFMFNFLGYSGKFIVQYDQIIGKGVGILLDNKDNLDIKLTLDGASANIVFKDGQGVTYEFNRRERSRSWSFTGNHYNATTDLVSGANANPTPIDSSWLLTNIKLTNGEEINFNYKADGLSGFGLLSTEQRSAIKKVHVGYQGATPCIISSSLAQEQSGETHYRSYNQIDAYILDEIVWKDGMLKFSTSSREDTQVISNTSRQRVDDLKVFPILNSNVATKPVKHYSFSYDYFNKHKQEKQLNWRLKLVSIKEHSVDAINGVFEELSIRDFTYNETIDLPSKTSNDYDHWGYFNGASNTQEDIFPGINDIDHQLFKQAKMWNRVSQSNLTQSYQVPLNFYGDGANRESSETYAKSGILTQIKYPTGGIETYDYELNEYHRDSLDYGDINKTVRESHLVGHVYDPITNINPFEYEREFEMTHDLEYFTLNLDVSREAAFELYNNISHTWGVEIYKVDGINETRIAFLVMNYDFLLDPNEDPIITFNHTFYETTPFSNSLPDSENPAPALEAGTYRIKLTLPEHLKSTTINGFFMFGSIIYQKVIVNDGLTQPETTAKAGGLRVRKITTDKNTREFFYNLDNGNSSGLLLGEYNYYDLLFTNRTLSFGLSCPPGYSSSRAIVKSSGSNTSLTGTITGNIVGYSKVEERVLNRDDSSKYFRNVYTYSNKKEELFSRGVPRIPLLSNGKLLKKELYAENSNSPSFVEDNDYSFFYSRPIIAASVVDGVIRDYRINSELYNLSQVKHTKKVLGSNGSLNDFSNTQKDFEYRYDNKHSQVTEIKSIDSKGHETRTRMYYPTDDFSFFSEDNDINNELTDQHIIDIPLYTLVSQKNNGETIYKGLHNNHRVYKNWGDNSSATSPQDLILPKKTQYSKGGDLAALKDKGIVYDYDEFGNVLEYSKAEGTHVVVIWGYNNQFPIAKIENATFIADKSNTISLEQQKLIDDAVSAANNDIDAISENSLQSSLKLLQEGFSKAMVTTYTYNPLIGVTSITDSKGYSTFFTYDGFNRLEFIKDADGNLVKDYEYHYQQQLD